MHLRKIIETTENSEYIVEAGKVTHFSLWHETGLIWELFLEV